jgi:phasin
MMELGRMGARFEIRRDTMPKDTTPPFEIPAEMRVLAEQSVEQAKQAFEKFISAANDTVNTLEGRAKTAQAGAKDVREKAMSYAEENVGNAFAFAQKVVRARDVNDLMRLQSEYIKTQMQVLTEQAQELGQTASKHAMGATKSQT